MLLRFGDPAAPGESIEHPLVSPLIERRELEPRLVVAKRVAGPTRGAPRELAQNVDTQGAIPLPPPAEPRGKLRALVELHPVEEVTDHELAELFESFARELADARLDAALDFGGVDHTIRQIERDEVLTGRHDPAALLVVQHAAELAEAPPELATRIVRHVPEEVAEPGTRRGRLLERQKR
jgi:hypothetical protein